MNTSLEEQADSLAERITESSPTWPGPLTEPMRFGQIPPKPLWIQQAVSGIFAFVGDVAPIYLGHPMQEASGNVYQGKVTAITDTLIVTVDFTGKEVATWAEPLSAVTAVEIISVDSAFDSYKHWPTGLSFRAHVSDDSYTFPVSNDPSRTQKIEAQAMLRAVLAAFSNNCWTSWYNGAHPSTAQAAARTLLAVAGRCTNIDRFASTNGPLSGGLFQVLGQPNSVLKLVIATRIRVGNGNPR